MCGYQFAVRLNHNHFSRLFAAKAAVALLAVSAALTGCRREEITVTQVPKEKPPMQMAPGGAGMGAHGAGAISRPTWKLPEGWQETEAGGVRIARFLISGPDGQEADASIIPLPRMQASQADLVNIWRDQIGLAPIQAGEIDKMAEKISVGPAGGELYEMVSEKPTLKDKFKTRVLVAIAPRDSMSWIFKMGGADELVRAQKPKFLEFLKSIAFTESAAPTGNLPEGHPPVAGGAAPAAPGDSAGAAKPAWDVPAGWEELPPTQMLLAKFAAKGDAGAKADITVSFFPGETGGLLANINRWRGQLELDMVNEAELKDLAKSLDLAGGKATVIDMDGTDVKTRSKARLVGVVFAHGGQTWFFKMLGDAKVVEREKAAFLKFVQSVKFPNA
jgi:hypothetical protein